MRWYANEVAPLVPLLIPVGEIVLWATFLALCLGAVYVAKAFFGTAKSAVGWIPFLGSVVERSLTDVEHKLVSILSQAAASCDAKMGAALHELARVIDWLGREIRSHANLLLTLSTLLLGPGFASEIRQAIALVRRLLHVHSSTFTHLWKDLLALSHRVTGIGADVLPRIRSLDRRLSREVTREKARARAAEHALDREVTALGKWVRSHPWTIVTDAFVGAVAIALTKLGLDWIKCDSAKKLAKKRGCGMWDDLDSLLGLAVTAIAIADLKTLVREAQKVEHATAEAIETLLRV